MKIAIDVRALDQQPSGVGNYVRNLLVGLANLKTDHKFLLCSNQPVTDPVCDFAGFEKSFGPFPVSNLWLQVKLPGILKSWGADCFAGTNFLAPIASPCPTVITVHDLSSFRMPKMHTWLNNMVQRLLPQVAKKATRVIAISETTKKDLMENFSVPSEKVRVVYNAVSDIFKPVEDERELFFARKHWILPKDYLLFVGTFEPRKNIEGLMRGFKLLLEKTDLPHTLVLCGGKGWGEKRIYQTHAESGLGDRVRFLGYVPNRHLPALYSGAAAFAFLSRFEGFGMPVLEAMSCGVPCLISKTPALLEVAKEGALAVSGNDPAAVAQGLEKVLTDQHTRSRLINDGQKRAREFSMKRFAQETLSVYEQAGSSL